MTTHIRWLVIIIVLTIFSAWVVIPKEQDFAPDFNDDGEPADMSRHKLTFFL
ncbi:MAG: hypothetical protein AAFV93_17780 [Chloroflexota bacterium]